MIVTRGILLLMTDIWFLVSFVEMTIVTHRFVMPRWLGALLQLKPFFTMERISIAWKKIECVGTSGLNVHIEYAGYT